MQYNRDGGDAETHAREEMAVHVSAVRCRQGLNKTSLTDNMSSIRFRRVPLITQPSRPQRIRELVQRIRGIRRRLCSCRQQRRHVRGVAVSRLSGLSCLALAFVGGGDVRR